MTPSTTNFSLETDPNLACSCCNRCLISQEALDCLQKVRDTVGRPLYITSGYRCENHPVEARKTKPGTHNMGIAFDIAVSDGVERMELVKAGLEAGANGIGVAKTFIHLDWREGTPVMWTY